MDDYIKGLIIGYRAFTDGKGIYRVFATFVCEYNNFMKDKGAIGKQALTLGFMEDKAREFIEFIEKNDGFNKPTKVLGYWKDYNGTKQFACVQYCKA